MKLATNAATVNTTATPAKVGTSHVCVPYSIFRIKVAAPTAQTSPAPIPATANQPASRKIIL
jgi:hypothetical protein